MIYAILICSFLGGVFLFCALGRYLQDGKRSVTRLEKYVAGEKKPRVMKKSRGELHDLLRSTGEKLSGLIFLRSYREYLRKQLERADLPMKAEELVSIHCVLVFLAFLYYPLSGNIIASIALSVLLNFIPLLAIHSRQRTRIKALNQQLGDMMVVISNSLKAGYSFMQSVEMVAKEMPPPVSVEFNKMLREMNLGVPTETSLENLLQRMPSKDLEMMVMAVLIQRQVGGNLSEVLDNISSTIRGRVKMKGEIRTLTAQGRISGVIISLLPVLLAVAITMINPSYMNRLYSTTTGVGMLAIGILMQFIGMVLVNRIVNVEV